MKYYENKKFTKSVGRTGFYTIIICCLLAIGGASWFAVARYNNIKSSDENSSSSLPDKSYTEESDSYTDSEEEIITPEEKTDVNNEVSDVPYEEQGSTPKNEERSFVLPAQGNIIKGYSDTALQKSETYGDMRLHTGIDIQCEKGTEIKSAGAGTVTAVDESSTLGKFVTIDHGDGITGRYCGLDGVTVNTGDSVSAGTVIGTLGSIPCECADKSHLHVEVLKDGKIVSPLEALGMQ